MERITIRIPEEQIEEINDLVEKGVYPNRSELIRNSISNILKQNGRTINQTRFDNRHHHFSD